MDEIIYHSAKGTRCATRHLAGGFPDSGSRRWPWRDDIALVAFQYLESALGGYQ